MGHNISKRKLYFFQINTSGNRNLLPLAAGLIVSYAKSIPLIVENYDISIKILREDPEITVKSMQDPDVVAFSCYSWNLRQNTAIAQIVKKKWPKCLVVFGGPSISSYRSDLLAFIKENPCVDVFVPGEGEITFAEILSARCSNTSLNSAKGISYVDSQSGDLVTTLPSPMIQDLDIIPSPFLNGVFDELLSKYREHITGSLWETNRGCPYSCAYCWWGQHSTSKIRTFGLERLYAELEWMDRNKIFYIHASDANFGILKRDILIAEQMAKREYPKFLMVNWAKYSSEAIFNIADVLSKGKIGFRITISTQSFNRDTLKAIDRRNMEIDKFYESIREANQRGFIAYTEIIFALPNETYETFVSGLQHVLQPFLNYYFLVYLCSIIPGTEMSKPEYLERYKIETTSCFMDLGRREIKEEGVQEYIDVVIATSTLSREEWKNLYVFYTMVTLLYNFRLAFFVLNYLKYEHSINIVDLLKFIIDETLKTDRYMALSQAARIIEDVQKSILSTGSKTVKLDITGSIHWESYEAALLTIIPQKTLFYGELWELIERYLTLEGTNIDSTLLQEVFAYQIASVPGWKTENSINILFSYNIPHYFDRLCSDGNRIKIVPQAQLVQFGEKNDYWEDPVDFAMSRLEGGCTFNILKPKILSDLNIPDTDFSKAAQYASRILDIDKFLDCE